MAGYIHFTQVEIAKYRKAIADVNRAVYNLYSNPSEMNGDLYASLRTLRNLDADLSDGKEEVAN